MSSWTPADGRELVRARKALERIADALAPIEPVAASDGPLPGQIPLECPHRIGDDCAASFGAIICDDCPCMRDNAA